MKRRSLVALATVALGLSLELATAASPALAGDSSGASALFATVTLGNGDCASAQSLSTGHFFIAIGNGTTNPRIIRITGPLPDQFATHCMFVGFL